MKRKAVLFVAGLAAIGLLLALRFENGAGTIEGALNTPSLPPISILHEEKTDKGSIVFYTRPGEDSLYTCFARKGLNGYKYVYGGVQGDAKFAADRLGMTFNYFPNVEKTPFPMYFGIICSPDIQRVKVVEQKRDIEGQARIVDAGGMRIWFIYMDEFQGSVFRIIGLSEDDGEVVNFKDDISPYYAEQKPLKNSMK